MPKLEYFSLYLKGTKPELIFDFLRTKNLKFKETEAEFFYNFESNLLQNIDIYFEHKDIFIEKKILKK